MGRREIAESRYRRAVHPLAWLGGVLIGVTLGLLGSGGSILTVPILVYLVGEPQKTAIVESLVIVGLIAAGGVVPYARKGLVAWHTVVAYAAPGMMGSYAGAWLAHFVSATVQLTAFGVLMLMAAALMLKPPTLTPADPPRPVPWQVAAQGLTIGLLTGFLGVGGGFLIVPCLVLVAGLPMHVAVGTSLATIAFNSAAGFTKSVQVLHSLGGRIHWPVVTLFTALGLAGMLAGSALAGRLEHSQLKRGFGLFLVVTACYILWRTLGGM